MKKLSLSAIGRSTRKAVIGAVKTIGDAARVFPLQGLTLNQHRAQV